MSPATKDDRSFLHEYSVEWHMLRARHHNVLIEGPVTATDAVLILLQQHLREPLVRKAPRAP